MKGWSGFFSFFGYVSILCLFFSFLSLNLVIFISSLFVTLFFFFFSGLCKSITGVLDNQDKMLQAMDRLLVSQSLLRDTLDPVTSEPHVKPFPEKESSDEMHSEHLYY